ncbi:Leucine rich repeat-containing protein [Lachnospiraceae bacterium XBB2008]|nr:Leucine rich repeat-containing protein [Lachnospiraceae bacterium XBB2008]
MGNNRKRKLVIEEGTTEIQIGEYADYTQLETVWMPDSIVNIGNQAFENCRKLKTVHLSANLERIGHSAFRGCAIEDIDIPNGVKMIGEWSFAFNPLTKVYIPDSVNSLCAFAFWECKNLREVRLPKYAGSKIGLGNSCFSGCKNLEKVEFSSRFYTIGSGAFDGCEKMRDVDLTEVELIKKNAFSGCTSLRCVRLDKIRIIEEFAFGHCTGLEKVEINNPECKVDKYAFEFTKFKSAPIAASTSNLKKPSEVTHYNNNKYDDYHWSPSDIAEYYGYDNVQDYYDNL